MISDPPSAGATQVIKTLLSEIVVIGAIGVVGNVGRIAPLPSGDAAEVPIAFIALIEA
jgi:hypothetical protein